MIRIFSFIIFIATFLSGICCTSAIIGADMTSNGRPLLWKLRDTSTTDNKVEYIPSEDGLYSYVALFNAKDKKLEEAWIGMNEVGFAVMNTASYNIKNDKVSDKEMDKEGFLMSKALQTCKTVDDFEALLTSLPKPLGVEANFGVIDAWGNGAYFETNNYDFVKYDLKDSPDHILVRTNYSHSGRPNEGYGFIREANAWHELKPYLANKNITPATLTEDLSRSFWHDLHKKDFMQEDERWIIDQDFMPRYKSTATVVIEGCQPLNSNETVSPDFVKDQYIMWTGMGYPPCSQILPVWCSDEGVPASLKGTLENGHCEMGDIVKKRRAEVFPMKKGNGDKYIDKDVLLNEKGTGYLQILIPQNLEMYKKVSEKRDRLNKSDH